MAYRIGFRLAWLADFMQKAKRLKVLPFDLKVLGRLRLITSILGSQIVPLGLAVGQATIQFAGYNLKCLLPQFAILVIRIA